MTRPETLQDIAETAPGILFRYDRAMGEEGRFPIVSRAVTEWLGLDPAALARDAAPFFDRVEVEDRPKVWQAIDAATREERRFVTVARVRDAGGQVRWLRIEAQPTDARSERRAWSGMITDVSEQERGRAFREAQQRVLERIATGASLAEVLDAICRLVEARMPRARCTILLLDREERRVRYGAAPTIDPDYMRQLEGLRIGPEAGSCGTAMHFGTQVLSPDLESDPKWAPYIDIARAFGLRACWSTPFSGLDGLPSGSLAVYFSKPRQAAASELEVLETSAHLAGIAMQRVEAQRALLETQDQLRHAQKMEAVGQLAGGVAHDFNNILTVVQGAASMLLEELGRDHDCSADVEAIVDAAERAAALTGQLLAFSRRQPWTASRVDVNEVVRRTEKLLRRLIGEQVTLKTELAEDLDWVWIDANQLSQVLVNLAVNARDAMPSGGILEISTQASRLEGSPSVRIEASDEGVGMDEETKERVFQPFFTTKKTGRGTGLGLATVFGIVERAGGTVDVVSAPGAGTVFAVELPIIGSAGGEDPHGPPPPRSQSRLRGMGEAVLLVEDDPMVRSLAARVLRSYGYEVEEADCGAVALGAIERQPDRFRLVLSDVVMPGMSGRELLERVRESWPDLPVLLMSGYTDDLSLLRECVQEGQPLLAKPFGPKDLVARVREAIDGTAAAPDPSRMLA